MGIKLLVPKDQLDRIQSNHAQYSDHTERCLISMFDWWFNNCSESTCEVLIRAVSTMGKKDVAEKLCKKYGEQLYT